MVDFYSLLLGLPTARVSFPRSAPLQSASAERDQNYYYSQ